MLSDDVKLVEARIMKLSTPSELAAWTRIKTAIVELGTTPNKQSTPCCFSCGSRDVTYSIHCDDCGADNVG